MSVVDQAETGVAMRVVRLDRNRFNQAVADGFYGCAPSARPGARRVFDMPDLVGLWFFARETDGGVSARVAGDLACRIASVVRSFPNEARVCIGRGINGASWAVPGKNANLDATMIFGAPVEQFRVFHVANVRDYLLRELADDRRVARDGAE